MEIVWRTHRDTASEAMRDSDATHTHGRCISGVRRPSRIYGSTSLSISGSTSDPKTTTHLVCHARRAVLAGTGHLSGTLRIAVAPHVGRRRIRQYLVDGHPAEAAALIIRRAPTAVHVALGLHRFLDVPRQVNIDPAPALSRDAGEAHPGQSRASGTEENKEEWARLGARRVWGALGADLIISCGDRKKRRRHPPNSPAAEKNVETSGSITAAVGTHLCARGNLDAGAVESFHTFSCSQDGDRRGGMDWHRLTRAEYKWLDVFSSLATALQEGNPRRHVCKTRDARWDETGMELSGRLESLTSIENCRPK